jgi:uncharacterized coiled-coil protein SlyX
VDSNDQSGLVKLMNSLSHEQRALNKRLEDVLVRQSKHSAVLKDVSSKLASQAWLLGDLQKKFQQLGNQMVELEQLMEWATSSVNQLCSKSDTAGRFVLSRVPT